MLAAAGAALVVAACLAVPSTGGAFTARIANPVNTVGAAPASAAPAGCLADEQTAPYSTGAVFAYSLAGTGSTETDVSQAGNTGTYASHHTTTATTTKDACPADAAPTSPNYWTLDGTSDYLTTATKQSAPGDFTIVVWFRTPHLADTTKARYIAGYGESQTALTGGQKDRLLYVDVNGYLQFGDYNGGPNMANSTGNGYDGNTPLTAATRVDDGLWHQAAAVGTASSGLALWLDGVKVGTTPKSSNETEQGWWRLAGGPLNGFPNTPQDADTSGNLFKGDLRFAAVYGFALSSTQVAALYGDGKPGT